MKRIIKIAFIALILSVSNTTFAQEDKVFVEKFIPNDISNAALQREKELSEDLLYRFKGDTELTQIAMKEVKDLSTKGIKVLTEEEYAVIVTKIHDLKAFIAFEENKDMERKYRENLNDLKKNYTSTKHIAKKARKAH